MSLQGGGSKPTSDATTTVPGSVLTDVAPIGTHPVAMTKDGYPGVASDNQPDGGLILDGTLSTNYGHVYTDNAGNLYVLNNIIDADVQAGEANGAALTVTDPAIGAVTGTWSIFGIALPGNVISNAGKFQSALGIGVWGHAAPNAQPLLATGASHTVDDVIALLQQYGLCRQV